ncbi:ATP-dependent Clp protease proteolytic subunit [Xylophilus sp. GOD-11R]|uniref:ATP-dependent Clp protease proteolytic subunit n=1 Tax=Xylophilus sp. GOD-11R TaxID=3089814 RepID=UPI00298D4EEB|nr:ATP-dependent Clp protease proteolytic subunit [Xylophilus sp. GOD-11R]WPB58435.1 ATP-dependent Clp protease proteolytic subunit [Xylophilus sp. GOD-11R]
MISNDLLKRPTIRLHGKVDDAMLSSFLEQMQIACDGPGSVLLELTTTGGDAETGRRIATDIILARERFGLDLLFLGKAVVYSAGISIMSGFPRDKRFLTRDCMLLVHERRLDKTLELKGAMRGMQALVKDSLAEIESALQMERTAFQYLVEGSAVSLEELMDRIDESDWYVGSDEALRLKLVAGIV